MMRRLLYILAVLACCACVGQPDDPETPDPGTPETPVPGGNADGSRFYRRVLALDFTATWCQYCPNMATAIESAKKQRPGRIVEVAVHYEDELSPPEAQDLVSLFAVNAFPTAVLDLDASTRSSRQEATLFTSYVDRAVAGETCGLALETSVTAGELTLKMTVKSPAIASYSAAALLVEDGIVTYQAGVGNGYVQNAVLRSVLGNGGVGGSTLGQMKAGEERTLTYKTRPKSVSDRLRIVAFVLQDGKVVNAATCALIDKTEYEYEANP